MPRPFSLVRPLLLALVVVASLGCDLFKREQAGTSGACPATVPLGRGCTTAHQVCDYEDQGKKYKCTCEPDTSGPSMWSCPVVP